MTVSNAWKHNSRELMYDVGQQFVIVLVGKQLLRNLSCHRFVYIEKKTIVQELSLVFAQQAEQQIEKCRRRSSI